MASVTDPLALIATRMEGMMNVLTVIANKSETTESTLQGLVQRVIALEARAVAPPFPSVPGSPSSAALEGTGVLPVVPEPPVAAIPPVPVAAPGPASPNVPMVPPGTPVLPTQAVVSTPAPTNTNALLAALTALASVRQAPRVRVDPSEEDSSIEFNDQDFSMMYPGTDEEFQGTNPALSGRHRTSLLMREQERAEKHAKEVQYTLAAPDYDHIKLTILTPWRVLQFWVAVLEYQTCHKLKLPVPSLIAETVKDAIIARYPELTADRINHIKDLQLQNYTIKMIQPRTKADFIKKMTSAVRFANDAVLKPNAEHFGLFYTALLVYRSGFTRMYDILSRDNARAVPECTMHPGGLIRLFLSKIPHGYGMSVYNNMSVKKYSEIVPFVTAFYIDVQRHFEFHLNTAELNDCFTGTAAEAFNKAKHSPGLHNIVADDISEGVWVDRPEAEVLVEEDEEFSPHDAVPGVFDDTADLRNFEATLAAMAHPAAGSKKDMACFTKLLHGTCNKQQCTYSHSEKLCNETRQLFIDMMRKVQRPAVPAPGSRPQQPSSMLKPSFSKPKLNAVAEDEEDN